MSKERIHRAISADGTSIAGRVEGAGPPLVLIHGILCDGEVWEPLVPHLAATNTCYLMSTRGRGVSDDADDLSGARRVEDVVAFVESIGEPVGLFGHSLGGRLALQAAAHCGNVSAVAVYDPALRDVLGEDGSPDLRAAVMDMAEVTGKGGLPDAAEAFFAHFIEPAELTAMRDSGLLDKTGRYVPLDLKGFQQEPAANPPPLSTVLQQITVPILLIKGADSSPWFHNGARYVGAHAPHSNLRVIEDAGHFAPFFTPDAVAAELRPFFAAGRASG